MEIFSGTIGIALLFLGIFLGIFLMVIFPIAAYRIWQDLPKIVNRLNTIIEILNQKGV